MLWRQHLIRDKHIYIPDEPRHRFISHVLWVFSRPERQQGFFSMSCFPRYTTSASSPIAVSDYRSASRNQAFDKWAESERSGRLNAHGMQPPLDYRGTKWLFSRDCYSTLSRFRGPKMEIPRQGRDERSLHSLCLRPLPLYGIGMVVGYK